MSKTKAIKLFWPVELAEPGPGESITLSQAARMLPGHASGSLSKSTLVRWMRLGEFPVRRIGKRYVTSRAAVQWVLKQQQQVAMQRGDDAARRLAARGA